MLLIRRMLLEHFGYIVLPATSVEDAKHMVEQQCPDMLLMDNGDPDIDYAHLADQVKRTCPEVITVVLSPYYRLSKTGAVASVDRYVAKDDGPDELMAQINELLGGAQEQEAHAS